MLLPIVSGHKKALEAYPPPALKRGVADVPSADRHSESDGYCAGAAFVEAAGAFVSGVVGVGAEVSAAGAVVGVAVGVAVSELGLLWLQPTRASGRPKVKVTARS